MSQASLIASICLLPALPNLPDPARYRAFITFLYVREDQLALSTEPPTSPGIKMFETLLAVSGIGPKVALSQTGTMPVDALENAISSGNVDPELAAGAVRGGAVQVVVAVILDRGTIASPSQAGTRTGG